MGRGCSDLKDQMKEDLLLGSLMWSLARFTFSSVVGLRVSVSYWLLAGGLPPFPATWAFHRAAHNLVAGFPWKAPKEQPTKVEQD